MLTLRKTVRELARGAALTRTGGLRAGWTFAREEVLRNSLLRMRSVPPPLGEGVTCNLCGWRGESFLTHVAVGYVDRNAFCPNCHSYPRHRGFAWLLERELPGELDALADVPGRRLLFAPEEGMLRILAPHVEGLEGADLVRLNEHVSHLEDLQALSFADESVAFVSCFHVLEHVPDDRRALAELHRVLHPSGRLLLCVPITFGRDETIEFGGPDPRMNDHCFDYGEDFPERLVEAGFSGTAYPLHEIVPQVLHAELAMTKELVFLLHRSNAGAVPEIRTFGA